MTEPTLLVPAVLVFALLILGLALTVWEFYTEKNIGRDVVEHVPTVKQASPDQVRGTRSKYVEEQQ